MQSASNSDNILTLAVLSQRGVVGALSGSRILNSQDLLLARTKPSLWLLGIAFQALCVLKEAQ